MKEKKWRREMEGGNKKERSSGRDRGMRSIERGRGIDLYQVFQQEA